MKMEITAPTALSQTDDDSRENNKRRTKKTPKKPKKITKRYLYNSGLYYLQRYPASTHHFHRVMSRKIDKSLAHHQEPPREDCLQWLQSITAELADLGYLNDDLYLTAMVRSYRRKGLALKAIQAKLIPKGFSGSTIQDAVQNIDAENENTHGEYEAAKIFIRRKKLGAYDEKNRFSEEQSLGKLARAGFSYDIAKKILEHKDFDAL